MQSQTDNKKMFHLTNSQKWTKLWMNEILSLATGKKFPSQFQSS